MSGTGRFCFWLVIILSPFTFSMPYMAYTAILGAYMNVTTLEKMSAPVKYRYPLIGYGLSNWQGSTFYPPNRYDLLWPNNLRMIFGPNILLWPIPFYQPQMEGRGMYWPKISW